MNIYKGNILTINDNDDVFNYLIEDKGKIIFVGNELPDEYKKVEVVNIGEKALVPAFCDTHQHFASFALFNAGLNVMEAKSNVEILEKIADFAKNNKSKLLIAFGASPYSVEERRLVSRKELDSVCPDKPLFMVKYDGHACVINTILLKKVEKKINNLRGFHPDTGEMNQEAFFAISDYVTNSISIPELIKNMQKAIDFEASKGIGMIHSVSGVGFPLDADISIENWFSKSLQNGYQMRVFPQSLDIKTSKSRKIPRIGGCFKCALDGCFGSEDAAMNEPYCNNANNSGVLYYSDEQVIEFCKKANREGLQIEMHAIGDKAFDQACRAIKAALDDYPRSDHRHGIIHACTPTEYGINICKQYNIQLPMQIAFDNWRQEPMEYIEKILGEERAINLNPVKTYSRNCVVSFGSDAPCTSPDPIVWLYKAINHSNPDEAVTIQQALRMATYNGYWTTFDEKDRGSLEKGKIADMVILSENPYEVEKDKILDIKVEKLILSGKEYKKQNQGLIKTMMKGILQK